MDCKYPNIESSMYDYLIPNIPAEQNIFCLKTIYFEIFLNL